MAFLGREACLHKKVHTDFWSRCCVGKHGSHPCTTTSKLQLNYRTIRNPVEWKFNNYRIKETTPIQTDRRCGNTEQAGTTSMFGG